jgi:predicted dinucleotide-binding enzyme
MKVGFLGAGRLAQTLGAALARAEHDIVLTNSRGPETLVDVVDQLGARATAGVPADLATCDVVVLAVPWAAVPDAVAGLDWSATVAIDPTNNRVGPRPEDLIDLGGRGSSEVVAELLGPDAQLVKAFNHQPIPALANDLPAPADAPLALFIAGDDSGAKATVATLIRDIGAEPIDTGSLVEGGRLQGTGGPLAGHGRILSVAEAHALLAPLQG